MVLIVKTQKQFPPNPIEDIEDIEDPEALLEAFERMVIFFCAIPPSKVFMCYSYLYILIIIMATLHCNIALCRVRSNNFRNNALFLTAESHLLLDSSVLSSLFN